MNIDPKDFDVRAVAPGPHSSSQFCAVAVHIPTKMYHASVGRPTLRENMEVALAYLMRDLEARGIVDRPDDLAQLVRQLLSRRPVIEHEARDVPVPDHPGKLQHVEFLGQAEDGLTTAVVKV